MVDETCKRELDCIFSSYNPPFLYDSPTLIYCFGNIDDETIIYNNRLCPIKYQIVKISCRTETLPALYTCKIIDEYYNQPQDFCIAEGLGIVSVGSTVLPGTGELFFAPFGGALDGIYKYKAPQLRYVTDGEENTVIYTAKGGYRLWDNYNGVERVVADGDVGDAADVLYYNLQGQPVSVPQPGGMYIRVDGGRATKVIAK